jgi:hypothetical protein
MESVITLAGKDWPVRYSIRALLYFEQIAGKPFKVETMTDTYILMYAFLLASNKSDFVMNFEQFMDAIADDTKPVSQFNEFFTAATKQLQDRDAAEKPKKKKGTEKN